MAIIGRCCLVSSCKISHFGMKPDIGGRPPRDRRSRGVMAVKRGAFAHAVAKAFTLVALLKFRVRKADDVITM